MRGFLLLIWMMVVLITIGIGTHEVIDVVIKAAAQAQLEHCLTRPWLDTSKGC